MKKIINLCIVCLCVPIVAASAQNKKNNTMSYIKKIKPMQHEKVFQNAAVGFYAVNLKNEKTIRAVNPDLSLAPASIFKLFTTIAALETLGEDFRFETTLQYDGEITENGELKGNIYIKGGGDPALGSKLFKEYYYKPDFIENWVNVIQAKGIKKITGAVVGDAQYYADDRVPGTWAWQDLGNYFGAGYSGLSIFDNTYEITFQSDPEDQGATKIIRTTPLLPDNVKLVNEVKGSSIDEDRAWIFGAPYQNTRIIRGAIPKGKNRYVIRGAIPDPAYWAAYTLMQALKKKGIEVAQQPTTMQKGGHNTVVPTRKELHIVFSPPLKEIIKIANQVSVNSYTEHMLVHLGRQVYGQGNTEKGVSALKKFWRDRGMNLSGMCINDSSGLSRYNALTAKQMVYILRYIKQSKYATLFYKSRTPIFFSRHLYSPHGIFFNSNAHRGQNLGNA